MSADIKFCGMTRGQDVRAAASLGAAYVGVIFAGGPRCLTPSSAAEVLSAAPSNVRRVGVFGEQRGIDIAEAANELGLDVVQLHGVASAETIETVRSLFPGEVWAVARLASGNIPAEVVRLGDLADALVLDAFRTGQLGGTGVTLPWAALADAIVPVRTTTRLVLAGGLRPENVAEAIRLLRPDVVDVSSGVETAPGLKDHARMRAFRDAVRESD